jgi:peptide/nickel transport system permease protein
MIRALTWRRLALASLAVFVGAMALGCLWQPYDPAAVDLPVRHAPISAAHPLGTDHLGRDLLSRLMVGGARTLMVLLAVTAIGSFGGTLIGTAAALAGSWVEIVVLRLAELPIVLPTLVVALAASAVFGLTPLTAGIALGLAGLGPYALMAHSLACGILAQPYMEAARGLGLPLPRQLLHHLLPNMLPVLLTQLGGNCGQSIVAYASLAFLGVGADTSTPDWGAMLFEYRPFIFDDPRLMLLPGLAIALPVTLISVLIDA